MRDHDWYCTDLCDHEAEVMRLANSGASIDLRDARALADRLAEAIRRHGPFMDDECKTALVAYKEARRVRTRKG